MSVGQLGEKSLGAACPIVHNVCISCHRASSRPSGINICKSAPVHLGLQNQREIALPADVFRDQARLVQTWHIDLINSTATMREP